MVIPYFKIQHYFIRWTLAFFEEVLQLAVLIKNNITKSCVFIVIILILFFWSKPLVAVIVRYMSTFFHTFDMFTVVFCMKQGQYMSKVR